MKRKLFWCVPALVLLITPPSSSILPLSNTYLLSFPIALIHQSSFPLFPLPPKVGEKLKGRDQRMLALLLLISIVLSSGPKVSESARIFTLINDCKETIWPGITPGENFNGGGITLKPAQSIVFTAPVGWVGRIWARTGCNFDKNGYGTCQTGSCGNTLKCTASGKTPASLAEFTLASTDYYDVSLVDGFNIPLVVTPINGGGNCIVAGCDADLRTSCPAELAVKSNGKTVACRSACDVFDTDEYCCRGVFGNSVNCHATYYSKVFKAACPTAYSYAYDDPTSIFTCSGTDYVVTFCSSRNQTVCTYHNNKLYCNASKGAKLFVGKWWALMLSMPLMINLWMIS